VTRAGLSAQILLLSRRAYVARHAFPTRGDKAVRAQSIRGRMALDGLYVPQQAPWRQVFEAEF
jgi:phage terminase large subunit-like protein